MTDTGRIMDKAATASRRALFAALQAAICCLVETGLNRGMESVREDLAEVERRLDLGVPYGRELTGEVPDD